MGLIDLWQERRERTGAEEGSEKILSPSADISSYYLSLQKDARIGSSRDINNDLL